MAPSFFPKAPDDAAASAAGQLAHPSGDLASSATTPPDLPLSGKPFPYDKLHPALYAAEFAGTALLVVAGLSLVIALWGHQAPFADWPLSNGWRRFVNGLLFGTVGAAIAYSPLGRISGAHVNPAMTFAFLLASRLKWRDASCYVVAQLAGAVLGAVLLLAWGSTGASVVWGAAVPSPALPIVVAVAGEIACTFLLVTLIFLFASHEATRPFAPLVNPPLFAVLSWLEGPVSGASANPARSLGPEVVGSLWSGWWVYWVGPGVGALLAVAAYRARLFGHKHVHQARLFHFGHPGGLG